MSHGADRRDLSESGRSGWENQPVCGHVAPPQLMCLDLSCERVRARPMIPGASVVAIGFGPGFTAAAMLFGRG